MSDTNDTHTNGPQTEDPGSNASGSQSDSAQTYDLVDSGQSEDIESSLTAQGVTGHETLEDIRGEGER